MNNTPYITVVLAMSADGKIADANRSPARFGSSADRAHLEQQIAQADGVLMGAATLRAYGTTLSVSSPELQQQRQQAEKPPQPVQIVVSRLAELDPHYRFFRQAIPRWLLTTTAGAARWQGRKEFDQILVFDASTGSSCLLEIHWPAALNHLSIMGLQTLAVLGGGELVASLLDANFVDELWLTVCPLLLGGATAPTPVSGAGFAIDLAPRLQLLSAEVVGQEVFLHYCRQHGFPIRCPDPDVTMDKV